jgi:hypothetical protein
MADLHYYRAALEKAGVVFEQGLTQSEIGRIETEFGFELLSFALPVSGKFIDWRSAPKEVILERLDWPADGMCFDIERDGFWLEEWGPRPVLLAEAFTVARRMIAQAPKLIPIFSHRYLPDRPGLSGNPVFSVYQTDIIYYGNSLFDYLENEFHISFGEKGPSDIDLHDVRRIDFWSELAQRD